MRPTSRFLPPLISALVLVLVNVAAAAAAAPSIVIDGSQLASDVPALVEGDHVLVPMRDVFEQLGARVQLDERSQTVTASLHGRVVRVTVGSPTAWVDGKRYALDVAAREVAGRVMVPLRFVAESLGAVVDYDAPSETVLIESGLRPGSFAAMTSGPALAAVAPKRAPEVEDARPASGSVIGSEYPSIYARFNGGTSAVDPSSVRVNVDGEDVTGSSTISSAYVSYTPASPLHTGQHTVEISGAADDGTPFSSSWTFRVDAGTSSDYTVGTYGGGYAGGFDGWGWPAWGFGHFGFFPPGFSVFTPGQLFFVSGGIIEVIFVSQFFPFGTAFFTISGFPGVFPLTPWLGFPGCFFGFARVPFGVTAHNAIIAARFETPGGRKIIVHSTAPLQIEGQRRSLPADLRYAVLPHLINHPTSPRHAVTFERIMKPSYAGLRPPSIDLRRPLVTGWNNHPALMMSHPAPLTLHPVTLHPVTLHPVTPHPVTLRLAPDVTHSGPAFHSEPIVIHPLINPEVHLPQAMPGMMPRAPFPMTQWQFRPMHEMAPGAVARPR